MPRYVISLVVSRLLRPKLSHSGNFETRWKTIVERKERRARDFWQRSRGRPRSCARLEPILGAKRRRKEKKRRILMRARLGLRLYAASTRARECTSARSLHSLAGSRKVVWTVKAALSFRASPVTAPGQLRNFRSSVFVLFLFQKLNLARLSPSSPATSNLRCLIFLASFSASEKKSHNLRRNVRSYYRIAHTLLRVIWLDILLLLWTIIVLNNCLY